MMEKIRGRRRSKIEQRSNDIEGTKKNSRERRSHRGTGNEEGYRFCGEGVFSPRTRGWL
ncbi:hypothetical protein WN51_09945 [Melipona quadrifasciata]|uniref:Uncharacterized protein n=1 Tax=Melipona quadrifasciata TaxID=166423 RepID=A0A0M9AA87_9HYME|nr:hypothetical protein WN51_09945 [Melipona quadrifasciata]